MSYTTYPYEVKPLPYEYSALEPIISKETLYYHHDKHYQTYVDNLNTLLESNKELQSMELEDLIRYTTNKTDYKKINTNAGGVYNHMQYFDMIQSLDASIVGKVEFILGDKLVSAIEASFYLDYRNRRKDYVTNITNIILLVQMLLCTNNFVQRNN